MQKTIIVDHHAMTIFYLFYLGRQKKNTYFLNIKINLATSQNSQNEIWSKLFTNINLRDIFKKKKTKKEDLYLVILFTFP